MRSFMVLEEELIAERLLAEAAVEQLSRVESLVVIQIIPLRETFAADVAAKRTLACVLP